MVDDSKQGNLLAKKLGEALIAELWKLEQGVDPDKQRCLQLIADGADVNIKNIKRSEPVLNIAIRTGQCDVADMMIQKGADVNAFCESKITPLMQACINGHDRIARTLVEYGADVNAKNFSDYTALMWAIDKGHNGIVAFLADHEKMDIDARDDGGDTALMVAAFVCNLFAVKPLVEKGVDVEAVNHDGDTALAYLTKRRRGSFLPEERGRYDEVVHFLEQALIKSQFKGAAEKGTRHRRKIIRRASPGSPVEP
ncbi:MAG: ankyrin repeat domain-containing protein [Alphaproteobacteria bacterium]|nr:ankyrin repeat domain-containing protein [Alphaproteobacteria bacterium]